MQGFLEKFFTKVKFCWNSVGEEYEERNYNGTGMVLQRYYNGITMLLVGMLEKREDWRLEFSGNFEVGKERKMALENIVGNLFQIDGVGVSDRCSWCSG